MDKVALNFVWTLVAVGVFVQCNFSTRATPTQHLQTNHTPKENHATEELTLTLESEELIRNLNEYLNPFSKCFIQLINFQGVDFAPFEAPLTLTTSPIFYSSRDFWCGWSCCRATIFLFPPGNFSDEDPTLQGDYYENGWDYQPETQLDEDYKCSRGLYFLILDRPALHRPQFWRRIINNVAGIGPLSSKLILTSEQYEQGLFINCLLLFCPYCNKWPNTFIPIPPMCQKDAEPPTATPTPATTRIFNQAQLDSEIETLNKMSVGLAPWFIDYFQIPNQTEAQRQHDLLARLLRKKTVNFGNVPKLIHQGLLMDNVLIQIAIPNLTLVERQRFKSTWFLCYENPDCDRVQSTPSLILSPFSSFFQGNVETLTFLAAQTHGCEIMDGDPWLRVIRIYIRPYDFKSWMYFLVCFIGVGAFFWALSKKYIIKESLKSKSPPFYMGLRLLLDQGDDNVRYSIQLGFLSWICAAWALMALVINNAYRDIVILELVAPLKPQGPRHFEELFQMNFDISRGFRTRWEHYTLMNSLWAQHKDLKGMNKSTDLENILKAIDDAEEKGYLKESNYNEGTFDPEFDLFVSGEKSMTGVSGYDLSSSKSLCTRKAFVDWSKRIEQLEMNQMEKYPFQGYFFKSFDSEGKRRIGWNIQNWVDYRIIRRIKALTDSGIGEKWRQFEKEQVSEDPSITNYNENRPLTLRDDLASLFYILGIFASISTIVFLGESRGKIWNVLKSVGTILIKSLIHLLPRRLSKAVATRSSRLKFKVIKF